MSDLDFRCECRGVRVGAASYTVTHARYDGLSSEGAFRLVVECNHLATQEDGLCDGCRADHASTPQEWQ